MNQTKKNIFTATLVLIPVSLVTLMYMIKIEITETINSQIVKNREQLIARSDPSVSEVSSNDFIKTELTPEKPEKTQGTAKITPQRNIEAVPINEIGLLNEVPIQRKAVNAGNQLFQIDSTLTDPSNFMALHSAQEVANFFLSGNYLNWQSPHRAVLDRSFLDAIQSRLSFSEIRHLMETEQRIEPLSAYVYLISQSISSYRKANSTNTIPQDIFEYQKSLCLEGLSKGYSMFAQKLAVLYLGLDDSTSFAWILVARYIGIRNVGTFIRNFPFQDPEFIDKSQILSEQLIKDFLPEGFERGTGRYHAEMRLVDR